MTGHPYAISDSSTLPRAGSHAPRPTRMISNASRAALTVSSPPSPLALPLRSWPQRTARATTGEGEGPSERTLQTRPGRRDHVERERHHGGPSAAPPALAPTATLRAGMRERLLVRVLRRVRPRDPHLSADLRADGRPPAHDLRVHPAQGPHLLRQAASAQPGASSREAEPTTIRRSTDPRRVASPCRPR